MSEPLAPPGRSFLLLFNKTSPIMLFSADFGDLGKVDSHVFWVTLDYVGMVMMLLLNFSSFSRFVSPLEDADPHIIKAFIN